MSIGARTRYAKETVPFEDKKKLVIDEHDTDDIVTEIKKGHKDYAKEYDQIADDFWTGDVESTGHRLFDVLKKHVTYNVEHEDNQCVKSPGAIIVHGHGDCKHYASFINGIADALHRQGKKIQCKYRFVSDSPGVKVHHVFAVLSDGHNEWWVDPVLSSFNAQPVFYNTTDVPMALYRVSGTGYEHQLAQVPNELPMVIGKTNIFKKIAHGMEVNAQNVKKGAQQTVKKVEHLALNVGLSPARNAFLALLDLNAFNLATRMSDAWASHRDGVRSEWQKLGGDEKKLLNAINNGRKHKAYYHHQAPAKKLSGDFNEYIAGYGHELPRGHRLHPDHLQVVEVPTLLQAYQVGPDHHGRMPIVSGIGEPVSVATLSALAAAIIATFAKFMKPDHGDQNALDAAKDGVANIVTNASDAIDAGQTDRGLEMLKAAEHGANAINTMQVAAGVGPDGQPTVAVTDFQHPQLLNAGSNYPDGGPERYPGSPADRNYPKGVPADAFQPDVNTPGGKLAKDLSDGPGGAFSDFFKDIGGWAKRTWENYKTPIVFTVVGVGLYKVATTKKRKR